MTTITNNLIRVYDAFARGDWLTLAEAMERAGATRPVVRNAIGTLSIGGLIEASDTRPARYRIVTNPAAAAVALKGRIESGRKVFGGALA